MKRIISLLLLLLLALAAETPASAQSAEKIISRYRKAIGGAAVKRIKSTLMSGAVTTDDGRAGRFLLQAASPDRVRVDIEIGELKVSECYNGKSAWRADGRGLRTLLGEQAKQLRLKSLVVNGRLADLSRNRVLAEPAGKASVEGRETQAVQIVKDEARARLFFDSATGLLLKQEWETAEGREEIFYGDYRAVDGVMEPFSIKINNGRGRLAVAVERVEHNRAVDEAAFRYPKADDGKPLPDIESLMKTLITNQEKIEELRERYTFRETETERKLDKDGRVKETETRVYDVTPVAGRFVQRLVSVNGKPLTPDEQEKEDRRVQKEVTEILKEREKVKQKQATARGRDPEEDPYENRSITILSFLRLSQITSMRREMFRGHEVIAFDFEPRRGARPKGRTESLVSKLAGTMWIDESARQIARIEARLTDSFKFAGGLLASISPSTAVALEQEKVDGEVWLPSYAEANIAAKVLLFAKFNRSVVTRYSEYKKSQIDSHYEMVKPVEKAKPR